MEYTSSENKNQMKQVESDTQRIVHRHLENKDDIITDEDIKNVRVGVTPAIPDAATLARFEDAEDLQNEADKKGKPLTPWDLVDGNAE